MNHPELITRTLDSHLTQPTRLILYGRAALALGYPAVPAAFHATMDVDAILPEAEMGARRGRPRPTGHHLPVGTDPARSAQITFFRRRLLFLFIFRTAIRRTSGRGEADHALPDTPLHSLYSVHSVVKNSSSSTPRHTTDNWARPTTLYFFRTQRRKMHALGRLPDHAQLIAS